MTMLFVINEGLWARDYSVRFITFAFIRLSLPHIVKYHRFIPENGCFNFFVLEIKSMHHLGAAIKCGDVFCT